MVSSGDTEVFNEFHLHFHCKCWVFLGVLKGNDGVTEKPSICNSNEG